MNEATIWVKNPLAIYAKNGDSGVVIKGQEIIELVASGKAPLSQIDEVYDASDSVVLPGLINTHHHFYQTLTRAYPEALNKELFPWLKSLYKVWANIQPEMLAVSTELALSELLLSGCTTASDHHYLFPSQLENAIDIQVEQAQKLGVRVVLTRGSMSLGEKDGGLPPQSVVQTKEQILSDSERLIKSYHNADKGAMTQIALAPCSPFSVTTELMQETAELAEQYDVRLHTHLAETIDEENFCLEKFGLRTVDYLESVGWLSERTWLAHGIHFNPEEIQKLGKSGVGICHCPSSNMMLASGICRSLELEEAGCTVGLGVDGSASNDGSNMIAELRQGMYLQRLRYGASKITHEHVYDWASTGSAKLLGRNDIGEIEIGKQADLALFKLDELRFSGSHDPLAALLLCGAQRADRVMVAGQWRVVDGKIVDKDEAELIHRHSDAAKKLRQLASA
jgi:8-oxoguanine deaminase